MTTNPHDLQGNSEKPALADTLVRVFAHPDAGIEGNRCQILPCAKEQTAAATNDGEDTQCAIWPPGPDAMDADAAGVRCWTATGRRIECCGHGLLGAAALWLSQSTRTRLTLQMNGSTVHCHHQEDIYWLSFERMQTRECALPQWLSAFFESLPQSAAVAGGEQGYLILEWPQDYPLQSLPLPGRALKDHTARALIVTTACGALKTCCNEDIRYRYFAPQYGADEDPATGSAMRILADYWHQRRGIDAITAYQCSAAGGLLYSRLAGDTVTIGGHVMV